MASTFIAPGLIISGAAALDHGAEQVKGLGSKALVVTDARMGELGNLDKVTGLLRDIGISYAVEDGINGEPDDGMIAHGLSLYQKERCDFMIALGGGSPIDAMKAISMAVNTCPMVAIPTTAGTGSEATQFAIITDRKTQVKRLLKGPALMPDIAIIDPVFTATVPREITAATGIDALTHAIEAYTSKKAQPLSDTFAVSACQRIFDNLNKVCENGSDENGRVQMSLAALEAGIAFNNSSVTIVHGMSRPIGALFHVPHGISNAMLLTVCLHYIADGAETQFAQLAKKCGLASASEREATAAHAFLTAVDRLLSEIGIPSIEEYGIDKEAFMREIPKMARDADDSGSPANTRKKITVEVMEMLYKELWKK